MNPCVDEHILWNSYYGVDLCCLFLHLCSQIYEKHEEYSDIPTNVFLQLYFFTTKTTNNCENSSCLISVVFTVGNHKLIKYGIHNSKQM